MRTGEKGRKTRVTHRPVVVTQNGRTTTVIVNLGDWEKAFAAWEESRQTREILADLQIGREQIAEGRTRVHKDVMRAMREKMYTKKTIMVSVCPRAKRNTSRCLTSCRNGRRE